MILDPGAPLQNPLLIQLNYLFFKEHRGLGDVLSTIAKLRELLQEYWYIKDVGTLCQYISCVGCIVRFPLNAD